MVSLDLVIIQSPTYSKDDFYSARCEKKWTASSNPLCRDREPLSPSERSQANKCHHFSPTEKLRKKTERREGNYLTECLIKTGASLGILGLRQKESDKEGGEEMKPVGI